MKRETGEKLLAVLTAVVSLSAEGAEWHVNHEWVDDNWSGTVRFTRCRFPKDAVWVLDNRKCSVDEMRAKGFVFEDCIFGGAAPKGVGSTLADQMPAEDWTKEKLRTFLERKWMLPGEEVRGVGDLPSGVICEKVETIVDDGTELRFTLRNEGAAEAVVEEGDYGFLFPFDSVFQRGRKNADRDACVAHVWCGGDVAWVWAGHPIRTRGRICAVRFWRRPGSRRMRRVTATS